MRITGTSKTNGYRVMDGKECLGHFKTFEAADDFTQEIHRLRRAQSLFLTMPPPVGKNGLLEMMEADGPA